MTPSITNVHVCGPLGQALAVVGGETWLYEGQSRRRPTNNEISLFFQHGLEIRQFDLLSDGILTEEKLLATLATEERCFEALHGLLAGMDLELTNELRRRSMRAANRVLREHDVAQFVERRFLRPLAAQNWDLLGANDLARAEKLTLADRLYTIVSQPLLQRIEDEIVAWGGARSLASVERAASVDGAYESGLVAAIVTAVHDGDPTRMREQIFFARNAKWNRQLAAHLIAVFAGTKSPTKERKLTRDDEGEADVVGSSDADVIANVRLSVAELLDRFGARKRREGRRYRAVTAGADALGVALKQIEWIIKQFETGHPQAGWSSVIDLARQQLTDGDPNKLAMSLTNLATRLTYCGETPFALCDLAAMCAPDDPAVWTARAELFRSYGRLSEALAAYESVAENFPQSPVARSGRAETLRSLGHLDEALVAYERTVEDFPQHVYARTGRAETLRSLGRFDEALVAYEGAIKDFPQNAVARSGRAETLRSLGRFDEALVAYERTIADFTQHVYARTGRAETLRALGRFDEALVAYDGAIEDFSQNVVARCGRAETLRSLGRFDEALLAYNRTIEDFPQNPVARTGRAETLRALGRFDEALATYDDIIKDFPQDAFSRNGYAATLMDVGKFDEARALLGSIESAPRSSSDWVAVHILCMIEFRQTPTAGLAERIERYSSTCPYPEHKPYFRSTLAVVRIALKQMREAQIAIKSLAEMPEFDASERAAVQLMEAHVNAAEGHIDVARKHLAAATNIVSIKEFQLRRLHQEVERRFGLGKSPPLTKLDEIQAADKSLIRLEMDFWVGRTTRGHFEHRKAA